MKIIFCFIIITFHLKAESSDTLSYYQKFNLALDSYQLGRFKLAEYQFSSILESKFDFDPTISIMIAYAMYSQKKYEEAIEILDNNYKIIDDEIYKTHSKILIADIYLTKGNNTLAFKNYLQIRINVEDSLLLKTIDEKLILCISNGLNENQIENFLLREDNNTNRSIINLARSYIAWLNGDYYNLKSALEAIDLTNLQIPYHMAYENLKKIINNYFVKPLTIAVILPLSGSEKEKGQSYLAGLKQFSKNSKSDFSLRFIVFNSESNSVKALSIVKNIQTKSFISGIIGPILEKEILAVSGFESSIPILIPNSGPPGLADITSNLFFLSPSANTVARRTAQIMINYFGFKNIAVLSPADKESKIMTNYFLNECNQLGVNPVSVEWYSEKPENISKQFKNIRKIAWSLVINENDNNFEAMDIDSIDALFDVDVTDFFSFPEKEEIMDRKDSAKVILETIDAFYIPIRRGELTYIGTQFPIYNFKTIVFGNENWLDIDVLKQKAIGPHVRGLKIISNLSSELLLSDNNLYINYFAMAIDHANFLETIIKDKKLNKRKYKLDTNFSDVFIGQNTSILFKGKNKNQNGLVQVLEFTDSLDFTGYFDGIELKTSNK